MAARNAGQKRRESREQLKARVMKIVGRLRKQYPDPKVELNFRNALELLVATILSAQCTDERVNLVTKDLFRKYRSPGQYAEAIPAEFEQEIRSTGFFRAKAKSIMNCCKAMVEKHRGSVPDQMEDLLKLPGIGRKTANVVLGQAFGIPSGIVVDTHVVRVAQRLRLTKQSNADKIEQDLLLMVPQKDWIDFGTMMVLHGRYVCQAKKPKCPECVVNRICPSADLFLKSLSPRSTVR